CPGSRRPPPSRPHRDRDPALRRPERAADKFGCLPVLASPLRGCLRRRRQGVRSRRLGGFPESRWAGSSDKGGRGVVRVIEVDGRYLIEASGSEVTALEDALYQRALSMEGHATDWRSRQHPELLAKMLDAVRRPYEAQRAADNEPTLEEERETARQ